MSRATPSRADRGAAPFGRVVVAPLDGTADGERALGYAAALVARLRGRLDVVHVLAPDAPHAHDAGAVPVGAVPAADDPAHAYLANVVGRVREGTGFPARAVHPRLLVGDAGPEVVRHAEAVGAAAVVLPTHARSAVTQAVAGSVALYVMRTAHCPAVLLPPAVPAVPPTGWPRAVVVATDGDPRADEAFAPLTHVVGPDGGGLLLTVAEPRLMPTAVLAGGGAADGVGAFGVAAVAARLRAGGLDLGVDERSAARPAHAVLDAARERGADLIAVATHGRRGVERLFGGSVAEAVVRGAACPVWVGHLPA